MSRVFWLSAVLLVSAAGCAADDRSRAPTVSGDTKAAAVKPQDDLICRTYPPPLGSLLGGRRICHTASEWEGISRDSQDATSDLQMRGQIGRVPGN
jgi:hypothetical protein